MAHEQEIVKVDSKGRITIPAHMRAELGMKEGSYASVRLNREDRSVVVRLFAGSQAKLVEIRLMIPDRPGALARAARALGDLNVDLLSSNSRTIKKGEVAEWVVVADVGQLKSSIEDVKKSLIMSRDAISVEVRELRL
ncbi:MAG: ACT domain-containing protein [Candidatus Methanomethylicia archaeon]|jgi:AbrB family looped-hinge helix DNA binding protein|nr:ACT domain-containing protein [Candidatus Methanomethylicia archaeon]MCQ5373594.1 ACT domain-containing protein [Candidatus Methanomethylicia archaeon]NHV60430.1 ACT domain-containing protein [Candidatus Verstraetearchaeota archaeon]